MRLQLVSKRPRVCPVCGGEVYDIHYGFPRYSPQDYFKKYGVHVIYGGCCIRGKMAEWACNRCKMNFSLKQELKIVRIK